jgi:hypothetical protein
MLMVLAPNDGSATAAAPVTSVQAPKKPQPGKK